MNTMTNTLIKKYLMEIKKRELKAIKLKITKSEEKIRCDFCKEYIQQGERSIGAMWTNVCLICLEAFALQITPEEVKKLKLKRIADKI